MNKRFAKFFFACTACGVMHYACMTYDKISQTSHSASDFMFTADDLKHW